MSGDWRDFTFKQIRELAEASGESALVESSVAAGMQQLQKALECMTTFADKTYAVQRATPHLEEAARIFRNIRNLKGAA